MHTQKPLKAAKKSSAVKKAAQRKMSTKRAVTKAKSTPRKIVQRGFKTTPVARGAFENNVAAGDAFMAKAHASGDYHSHEAGFLYRFITPGQSGKGKSNNSSPKPAATQKVEVHYEGKLINGTVFDSSYKRGETISFGLNQVIPGWKLAVQTMSFGDVIECILPQSLAYGQRGAGRDIGPGETLIFKIELFEQQLPPAAKAGKKYYDEALATGKYMEHPAGFLYQYLSEAPAPGAATPGMNETANVNYVGRTVDQQVFDKGNGVAFPLNGVVPGFAIPISQLMTKGTKIRVILPSDLAYGAQSPTPAIPPHSTLIFEIELNHWGMGNRFF